MSKDFIERDPNLNKFLNILIIHGKKSTAKKIIKDCGNILKQDFNLDPQSTFLKAIEAVKPALEVKSIRKGGTVYQVPLPISAERRRNMAIRWIIQSAKKRKETSMAKKIAFELEAASKLQGKSVDRRNQLHALAEANRAFAHLRWKLK